MLRGVFFLSFICFSSMAFAGAQFDDMPSKPVLAYVVAKPDGTIINQQNRHLNLAPASTQKLITATAARMHLGGSYRFNTQIETLTEASLKQGTIAQDLRFRLSGAPDFTRKQLWDMLKTLKQSGVKKITGDILINDGRFNGYHWSNGQSWNDLGVCYTSPASAVIINRNCVQGNLSVTKEGATRVFIPAHEPIRVDNSTYALKTWKEMRQSHCALELNRGDTNHYELMGCFVATKDPIPMKFSVNDPVTYFASILAADLKGAGITHTGVIRRESTLEPEGVVLVRQRSATLDSLLKKMLKKSDNLIADVVFKTLGAEYYNQAGSFRSGEAAVKAILKSQAKLDLSDAIMADGSGLSRHNLVTVDQLLQVMQFVYNNDNKLKLLDSLAVSGVDGTLKWRTSLRVDELKGKVRGKTGSLKSVVNMVGVIDTQQGPRLFAYMVSGYNLPPKQARLYKNRLNPIRQFERDFFTELLTLGKTSKNK
ncbi:D-alanyl-D-alanine carboxypeptidase/D-alanyl-D-alanine-endopeptidase [Motilimonas sp. 1_MG-2023]|uniref:D-alanyl-D-alanine carboxypeptidase/D-alanyl-D-alanine endopeptidase n=1 Tax=Motilimonas sp. 1_MG-2023 TaxID=3062672 RepID=UPI0026E13821|nr:D-alanyl-D-alanine carboxypeptidase/D-alanyl-D-alanine-endopeptidase [Motilimonas sp. 1_MG-2023]MDO6527045.1 D-alanyl-D-alanine carboxypeptidase/D-alanyl-D-alanine-endopeptidase [Motilimonas sp. 1_MG-2023]